MTHFDVNGKCHELHYAAAFDMMHNFEPVVPVLL